MPAVGTCMHAASRVIVLFNVLPSFQQELSQN